MTRDEVLEQLRSYHGPVDPEIAHSKADALLCAFLRSLGYDDVVEAYEQIEKWYA